MFDDDGVGLLCNAGFLPFPDVLGKSRIAFEAVRVTPLGFCPLNERVADLYHIYHGLFVVSVLIFLNMRNIYISGALSFMKWRINECGG